MENLTKEVFAKEIDRLILCFPKTAPKFDKETMAAWYKETKDIDCEGFTCAVTKIIKTNKFFPSISELRAPAKKGLVY